MSGSAIEEISAPIRAKVLAVKEMARNANESVGTRRRKPSRHARTGAVESTKTCRHFSLWLAAVDARSGGALPPDDITMDVVRIE